MIKAIVFDLDDTLYSEIEYVKSGFKEISKYKRKPELVERLFMLFNENPHFVYQRAGFSEEEISSIVEIYRNHVPDIKLDEDTEKSLYELKKRYKLGIITDGRIIGQKNKIYSLGLENVIDEIIITDELGGELMRKPNPKAFILMKERLNVEFDEMMYVGDNPEKDFYIGSIFPIKTVRIVKYEGIYSTRKYMDNIREHITINNISELIGVI